MLKSSKWLLAAIIGMIAGMSVTAFIGWYGMQGSQTYTTTYTTVVTYTSTNTSYSWSNAMFQGAHAPLWYVVLIFVPFIVGGVICFVGTSLSNKAYEREETEEKSLQ